MIDREFWGIRPEWLDWVLRVWDASRERVQLQKPGDLAQTAFSDRAATAFKQRGIPARRVKTYVSVQVPEGGEGYAPDYPHIHYPVNATTLVHYLDPGDKPAPLHIFDGDDIVEEIYPEAGLTVFMPNNLKHGVLRNHGTKDRIQLIATALRA